MSGFDYKIALLVPYFGKFPSYFPLWLRSCQENPEIDWIILTDDTREYAYPNNVHVHYTTFGQVKQRIQRNFDFAICLDSPYKLCDYRPAYGEVFDEHLVGYDFWGYCDVDVIFGRIKTFITSEILSSYEKVLCHGSFTLIKNRPDLNSIYRLPVNGVEKYKRVFTSPRAMHFDEGSSNAMDAELVRNDLRPKWLYQEETRSINFIFEQAGFRTFHGYGCYAEINVNSHAFKVDTFCVCECVDTKMSSSVFCWESGMLKRYYLADAKIGVDEYMYIHLQKRPMAVNLQIDPALSRFQIKPNEFAPFEEITESNLTRWNKNKWVWKGLKRSVLVSRTVHFLRLGRLYHEIAAIGKRPRSS